MKMAIMSLKLNPKSGENKAVWEMFIKLKSNEKPGSMLENTICFH